MKRRAFLQSMLAGIAVPTAALSQDTFPDQNLADSPAAQHTHTQTDPQNSLETISLEDLDTLSGISDGTNCTFDD